MQSDWIETTIGAQVTLQRGIDITKANQRAGSVPVVSSGGIASYHDTAAVRGPGVVLGRKGVVGSVYYIVEDFWPHDTSLWVKDFHGNDPRFVYYFFRSIATQLSGLDVGSANPTLNRNHVHPLPTTWPAVHLQREISGLLGLLDDKIALLKQTSSTLEAIAQAIFKSWFIDFDPVKAKSEGRTPDGIDAETAALFPDSFEESALGAIPKGWRAGTVGDLLSESTARCKDQLLDVLSAVQAGELVRSAELFNKKVFSEDISKYKIVAPGSFAYNPSRINIGSIGLNEFDCPGAVSPIYVVLNPRSGDDAMFAWHHLRTQNFRGQIEGLASGSVRQSLSARDFLSIPLVIPDVAELAHFASIRKVIFDLISSNKSEAATLTDLRDTLLPRLISGKLKLPELQEVAEAV